MTQTKKETARLRRILRRLIEDQERWNSPLVETSGLSAVEVDLTRRFIAEAIAKTRLEISEAEIDGWSEPLLPFAHEAVERLPPMLRRVTGIPQSGDLSVVQVVAIAGISVAAAKSRLLGARE